MESKHDERSSATKPEYTFIRPQQIISLGSAQNGLYTILGLQPSASCEDIRKAYKRMALDFHPDKISRFKKKFDIDTTPKELTECFKWISTAGCLSDPDARRKYDGHTHKPAPHSTKQTSTNQSRKQTSTSSQDWFEQFYQSARQSKIEKLRSALEKAGMSSSEGMLDERIIRLCDLIEQLAEAELLNSDNLTKIIELFSTENPVGLPNSCIRILDNLFETLSEHPGLFTQNNLDTLLSLRAEKHLDELNELTKLISKKRSLDQDMFNKSVALLHKIERQGWSTEYSHAHICIGILQNIHASVEITPPKIALIFEHLIPINEFQKSIPQEETEQAYFWSKLFENPHEIFDFLNSLKKANGQLNNDLDWQELWFAAQVFFILRTAGIESTSQDYHPSQYIKQLYLLTRILESRGLLNQDNAKLLLATKNNPHNRLSYYKACQYFDLLPEEFKTNDNFIQIIHTPEVYAQLIPLFLFSDKYNTAGGKVRKSIPVKSIRYMFQYPDFLIAQLDSTKSNIILKRRNAAPSRDPQLGLNGEIEQQLITALEQMLVAQQAVPPAAVITLPMTDLNSAPIHQQTHSEGHNPPEKSQLTVLHSTEKKRGTHIPSIASPLMCATGDCTPTTLTALDSRSTSTNQQPDVLGSHHASTEEKRSTPISRVLPTNDGSTRTIPVNQHNAMVTPYNMTFFLKCLCLSLLVCALTLLILSYAAPGVALNLGLVLHCSVKTLQYAAGTGALVSLVGLFALNQREPNTPLNTNVQQQAPSM